MFRGPPITRSADHGPQHQRYKGGVLYLKVGRSKTCNKDVLIVLQGKDKYGDSDRAMLLYSLATALMESGSKKVTTIYTSPTQNIKNQSNAHIYITFSQNVINLRFIYHYKKNKIFFNNYDPKHKSSIMIRFNDK